jgi:hypothetical protein
MGYVVRALGSAEEITDAFDIARAQLQQSLTHAHVLRLREAKAAERVHGGSLESEIKRQLA